MSGGRKISLQRLTNRILVLDHGKVVEFDTPWELLKNEAGVFRDLARQSGEESQLFEVSHAIVLYRPYADDRWPAWSMRRNKSWVGSRIEEV